MTEHVALVTGAGGNIGRAIALALAEPRASLVLTDLPAAAAGLEATQDACRQAGAVTHVAAFDVRHAAVVDREVRRATDVLGPITRVANNAGYQGMFDNVVDYDLDDARRVLEINVLGVLTVLQVAARLLRESERGGSIVNIASMAHHGAPNMPAYSATRAWIPK